MSSTTTAIETLTLKSDPPRDTTTYGKLRYVPAGQVPKASPHNFHLPELSEFGDVRYMPLHDMRPLPTVANLASASDHAQLATHGFTAVCHPVTMHSPPHTLASWKDPSSLKATYIPETETMLKALTGCSTVITETLLLRSQLWTESDALATHAGHGDQPLQKSAEQMAQEKELSDLETGFPQFIGFHPVHGGASPAPKIHLDYAPGGARTHIRKYHPELTEAAKEIIEAEDKLEADGKAIQDHYNESDGPRWALFCRCSPGLTRSASYPSAP